MKLQTERQNIKLSGHGISRGQAIGTAFVYRDILLHEHDLYDITKESLEIEYKRIEDAINDVVNELKESADQIEKDLDQSLADIFLAQKALLEDKALLEEFKKELESELINAEEVVKRVLRRIERRYAEMDNEVIRQRGEDLNDIARRLLRSLSGIKAHTLENLPEGSILVARHLVPSSTVFLSRNSASGVVVEIGGTASHAALLTREMSIPAVTQISDVCEKIITGDKLLVNGYAGTVIINPDKETERNFKEQILKQENIKSEALEHCHKPARTQQGKEIKIMANIGCYEDSVSAAANGADGIGLYRIEQFYLSKAKPPSEQEILDNIRKTLQPMKDKPTTVRLLDAGADKDIPFLNLPAENNPFLGVRGVRLLLKYPEITKTQLKVLSELFSEFNLRILVPMITTFEDLKEIRNLLEVVSEESNLKQKPPLGAMIETPAAVMCVKEIATFADFLSIGTNDLTQYTMAAGRENNQVSDYYIDNHPAIMKLIEIVSRDADCPVEICGELASNINVLTELIKLGINNLSVPPSYIPEVKETIRKIDF